MVEIMRSARDDQEDDLFPEVYRPKAVDGEEVLWPHEQAELDAWADEIRGDMKTIIKKNFETDQIDEDPSRS